MPVSVAFLGPHGTYGERATRALMQLEGLNDAELLPCVSLRSVVEHVADGRCDAAVVPVENSVEGGVTASLDALWSNPEICIRRAVVLPIRHALLSSGTLREISEVLSHPQALAQCAAWLQQHLPHALQLPTSSTAEAARLVQGSRFRAAVASRRAGQDQGVAELAYPINDQPGNCTRFLLLRRTPQLTAAAVHCTSLAFSLKANAPGALLEALEIFAARELNMSRIESRPSKRELGEYVFFVDLETCGDALVVAPLVDQLRQSLQPLCERLTWFGTYPISDDTVSLETTQIASGRD